MLHNLDFCSSLKTRVRDSDYCIFFCFSDEFHHTDIERTYGQRKLLAHRTPLFPASTSRKAEESSGKSSHSHSRQASTASAATDTSTPAATEGETATESELETETETELEYETVRRRRRPDSLSSVSTPTIGSTVSKRARSPVLSQHDLLNRYFRKDSILFHNIDLLR